MTDALPVIAFLPEVLVLAGALLVFLLDSFGVRRLEVLGGIAAGSTLLAIIVVLADLRFAPLGALATLPTSAIDAAPTTTSLYAFSSLGLVFQGIFLTSAFLVALASLSRPSQERGAAVFFGLLLMATVGMLLVAIAADLIFLLLAIEVTGISTYLMVGYTRRDPRGLEAAMKFYIIGALSTALSFFGASLLFGAFGGTSFVTLGQTEGAVAYSPLALLGYGFLLVGLGFKVTAVPFHMWAVDVYDGAPHDVTAFLAGGTKKIGIFAFFLVFIGPVVLFTSRATVCGGCTPFHFGPTLQMTLAVLAILTMTVGNVLALLQKEMKRMLAYSSISQAGYMLIGIAIGTAPALAGATLQVFAHVFMKAGAFLVVAAVASLGVGPLIDDWRGLGVARPGLGVSFALMLLSLAGVPLTVGFVSKFVLFSAAVQSPQHLFLWLAVLGLLNSALSVFYYARVLRVMFMEKPGPIVATARLPSGESPSSFSGIGLGRTVAILLATAAILVFGVDPQLVLGPIQSAASHFVLTGA
ncbi:MAG: NADH-quinone oxidoreductase subunit N [Thermoplasmata archaeon]